jgi:hypothetical protein
MRSRTAVAAIAVVLLVAVGGAFALGVTSVPGSGGGDYEWRTVTLADEDGTTLATVRVRIADTAMKRYTGLSETSSLGADEGMLFVHDGTGEHTYVMRRMEFPLDIVFVDANGTITTIHHAPVPEATPSEDLVRYSGRAKYVLEVPRGYTEEHGVDVGDRLIVPEDV